MLEKFRGLLKLPLKLIPIVVFGILLTSAINIMITYVNYNASKEELSELIHENDEEFWSEISEIIEENYYSNKLASKIISLNLEKSILKNYSDLNELEREFNNGIYSKDFYEILRENVERDDLTATLNTVPYFTIIGKLDSVLVTFSNNDNIGLGKVNTKSIFTWEDVANLTPNPEFAMIAIDKIINNDPGIIFVQTGQFSDEFSYTKSVSMKTLKEVYDEKGLDGLKKFSLLAPSYITESGDIFDNRDKYYLSRNFTHKIITVQVISLDSIFKDQQDYINMKIKNNEMEVEYLEKKILSEMIVTVLISLMLFIISLILIGIHNAETDRKRNECGECSKEGE